MPVPVPLLANPPAHLVLKHNNKFAEAENTKLPVFQHLTRTLPTSPTGPPPSFGTREQWINSLPSWRRTKIRRIWEEDTRSGDTGEPAGAQNFTEGLAGAGNASVIKGTHVETCIPPLYTLLQNCGLDYNVSVGEVMGRASRVMSSECSLLDQIDYHHESQWSASSSLGQSQENMDIDTLAGGEDSWPEDDYALWNEQLHFTRPIEEPSPEMDNLPDCSSSPIGPITPFGEYVDRAVATSEQYASFNQVAVASMEAHFGYWDKFCGPGCTQCQPRSPIKNLKSVSQLAEPVATPTATVAYRKLAEPLAEWVVRYVWQVCTTGMALPPAFYVPNDLSGKHFSPAPPAYLAASVHSLFLSTLLQPSAIFLALWYIVRLPVFFGDDNLGMDAIKERSFKVEMLGYAHGVDGDFSERDAAFKVIVLGCMFANKWLDDHTFSNKTWHTISNIPIQSLNSLETLALDMFSYDLSILTGEWSRWLDHLMVYHRSLASSTHPQPISRPSANPQSIIRRALEDIIKAPTAHDQSPTEPVFLGLEQRVRAKLGMDDAEEHSIDAFEIDLDEDGPIREEYLPKRRVSGASNSQSFNAASSKSSSYSEHVERSDDRSLDMHKTLPPPAKWSPAGDEPIIRDRKRGSGQYMAVQPPTMAPQFPLPSFHNWPPPSVSYAPIKPQPVPSFTFNFPHSRQVLPQYVPAYSCDVFAEHGHTRSCCDQDIFRPRSHMRSYSNSRFDYRCSDIRMTAHEAGSQLDAAWPSLEPLGYVAPYRQPFGPHPSVNYQSTW